MDFQLCPTPEQRKSLPSRGLKTSPLIWMEEKKNRDQKLWKLDSKNYWIVQNKYYDLSSFVKSHPGGESWLRLTQGQDVTQQFIVHHLNQKKARDELAKYYVGECPQKVSRYTFKQDGIYRIAKRRILQKYSIKEIQDESSSKMYGIILLLSWIACVSLAIYKNSYIFGVIAAFLMIGLLGIGHNFVHHHQSFYRYFFLLVGFTHRQWQIMHCISHHFYPNTELDYENAAFQPIGYYIRSMPKNKWYCMIILEVIFTFIQPLNMILKLFIVPIIKKVKPDILYAFPLTIFFLAYLNSSFIEALKLYLVIYCTFGFVIMKLLFCGHRVQDTWTEGAQKIQDFGEHTICATSDTDIWIQGIWSFILLAGFNVHVAHHFFPTADHRMLPKLNQIIRQICRQKGLKKNEKSRLQCMISIRRGFLNRIPYVKK